MLPSTGAPLIPERLSGLKKALIATLVLGVFINILSFTSPLFMMQVMDSVVPGQDRNTLIHLLLFGGVAFMLMSAMESLRRTLAAKSAIWAEARMTEDVFAASGSNEAFGSSGLADVRQISAFLRSGALTIVDAPISILSFFILWLIHPAFLLIAIATAALVIAISFAGSAVTASKVGAAGAQRKAALSLADALGDAGPVARVMGVDKNVVRKFMADFSVSLSRDAEVSGPAEIYTGATKFFRQFAQIAALSAGAVYVMNGELSGGAMIAGSIIMGKALLPFDQLAGAWNAFIAAAASTKRLREVFAQGGKGALADARITPDKVKPVLRVANVTVPRGAGASPILDRISFMLNPGECLAIVGASASGKTTLGEIIAGAVSAPIGEVSLDGIPYDQFPDEQKAALIGYAPQAIQFFPGSIAENVARFTPDYDKNEVLDAVKRSETEVLIRETPAGFDTVIDARGRPLSIGHARRVSLARALFGRPKLVILDEPTSDLDANGEKALVSLIGTLKQEGAAIILIAQRAGLLSVADKLMQLENGRLRDFGQTNEVLARLSLKRRQIDMTLNLDEMLRLSQWLDVNMARASDMEIRPRAELALVEIFNTLRQRKDLSADEKVSVTIDFETEAVRFSVYSGAASKLFGGSLGDATEDDSPYLRDLDKLTPEELGLVVLRSVTSNLEERIEDDRLIISFFVTDTQDPVKAIEQQVAV